MMFTTRWNRKTLLLQTSISYAILEYDKIIIIIAIN